MRWSLQAARYDVGRTAGVRRRAWPRGTSLPRVMANISRWRRTTRSKDAPGTARSTSCYVRSGKSRWRGVRRPSSPPGSRGRAGGLPRANSRLSSKLRAGGRHPGRPPLRIQRKSPDRLDYFVKRLLVRHSCGCQFVTPRAGRIEHQSPFRQEVLSAAGPQYGRLTTTYWTSLPTYCGWYQLLPHC